MPLKGLLVSVVLPLSLELLDADCHRQRQVLELVLGLVLHLVMQGLLDLSLRMVLMQQQSLKVLLSLPEPLVLPQQPQVSQPQIWRLELLFLLLRCRQTH